jgi:phasin family protein
VVDKPVSKKTVAKPVATKSAVKSAPVATPVVAAKVEAPKPIVTAPVVAKVEAPKSIAATPAIKPVITETVAVATPVVAAPVETPDAIKAPITTEGKKVMNDTVTKVQETAQKFTADATARATEVFGDVSARAKTAMEKGSKGLEEMVEFSKGNLEAVVASGRVAAKGAQDIAKYSAEYGRKSIEEANATAKKFAAVKSPTEFFALQSEVAKTNLDAMVGEASKFAEGYMKLLGEIVQPMQNRYAVAVEKVKSVTAA